MQVNLLTYGQFNDVRGFHDSNKPWKKYNQELVETLGKELGRK